MTRRIAILTEGFTNPFTGKTAASVIRYRRHEIVAVIDSTCAGATAGQLLQAGGDLPVVASLDDARNSDTLLIGIAPPGGRLPDNMRRVVLQAIERGMTIISGLHQFIGDDPQFAEASRRTGAVIQDVRKNNEKDVANRQGIREQCLRLHTVGNDCSVGKMVTSIEVTRGLQHAGHDAKFVATGQTGIMIEGDGCPIDCVVADFINGAAEKLVLANQHHDIILIEGQGCITHPRYSAVTLGLLHGSMPDGLYLCYEAGRTEVAGMPGIPLTPLKRLIELNEAMAGAMHPCKVIGIGINSRRLSDAEADRERQRIEQELGLPACDVLRHGSKPLVDAALQLKRELGK